jgi:cytochrome c-type biogenesis protein CcmH/NrfG
MEPEATRERIAELERQLADAMAAAQAEDRGSEQSAQALDRIAELSDELGQLLQTERRWPSTAETTQRAGVFGGMGVPRRRIPVGVVMLVVVVLALLAVPVVSAIYANRGGGDSK